jgi:hypothetical protein
MQNRRQLTTTPPKAPLVNQLKAEDFSLVKTKSPGPKNNSSKNSASPGSSHSISLHVIRRPSTQRGEEKTPPLENVKPKGSNRCVLTVGKKAMDALQRDENKNKTVNAFETSLPKCEDLNKKLPKKLKDDKAILAEFEDILAKSFQFSNRLNNECRANKNQHHLEALNMASADAAEIVKVSETLSM